MDKPESFMRRVRSFVKRDGRMTAAQRQALHDLWPQFGLASIQEPLALAADIPHILEIGFGSGFSLLEMAKQHPTYQFLGVEMYLPGIATLLQHMQSQDVHNIKIFYADAVEVLQTGIPVNGLAGIQLFFPDPWPKRRHHKRRIIQPAFVELLAARLKMGGLLHLATDWQDYAEHMLRVISACPAFENVAGSGQYAHRSAHRPIVTKFESRGQHSGRPIFELQFTKKSPGHS
jgi:tRNA (guanine-N7-)-methyltransferase